ncbi:hypothetical protein A5733_19780 [Mycobacterium sp. NS-7484]|uniref:hypothetical protein n=1 Tax=unclassified Mycobacterium TaxID=2642494 RepID=UPI000800CE9C|nr:MULTISPECIES: hypothetical protein [unclassified Mycobacterium]OBG81930.1 hypothetical protein A5699_07605 [Mycobacterium sp. E802]OMC05370.1 hypothetical protein A5733_19780 [Mycobacterium sp. NS-7484]
MNRLSAASAAAVLTAAALTYPASATAAANSAVTSIPSPAGTIEMHVNAECSGGRCTFNTHANLLTPEGPIGFPGDTWARQTITLRSTNKDTWQEASYSAPAGMPREIKGSNHDNVLSKLYRSLNRVEISATYFGGGPIERFTIDGESVPTEWRTGQPNTKDDFIVCSVIQVVYGGVNLTTPTACTQTGF